MAARERSAMMDQLRGTVEQHGAQLVRQETELRDIKEQLQDLRALVVQQRGAGINLNERPIVGQVLQQQQQQQPQQQQQEHEAQQQQQQQQQRSLVFAASATAMPLIPHRPPGGANANYVTPSDKLAWDKAEKERWLAEMRAGPPLTHEQGEAQLPASLPRL